MTRTRSAVCPTRAAPLSMRKYHKPTRPAAKLTRQARARSVWRRLWETQAARVVGWLCAPVAHAQKCSIIRPVSVAAQLTRRATQARLKLQPKHGGDSFSGICESCDAIAQIVVYVTRYPAEPCARDSRAWDGRNSTRGLRPNPLTSAPSLLMHVWAAARTLKRPLTVSLKSCMTL